MTTIRELKNDLNKARQLNREGNLVDSARIFLNVQRLGMKSRSRFAAEIVTDAHCFAQSALVRGRNAGADQPTMSELGRIKAESEFLLHGAK